MKCKLLKRDKGKNKKSFLIFNIFNAKGQALVEFSLIFSLAMYLSLGILDLVRIYYTQEALQHAVREGARYGTMGKSLEGATRVDSIVHKVQTAAQMMGVTVDTVQASSKGVAASAGKPGDYLTVSAQENIQLWSLLNLAYGKNFAVNVSVEARNEYFVG